ncbi:unnamed protein product, partial [Hapterophycus canaliculatus]
AETLQLRRVAGPTVLPPPRKTDGKGGNKKRVELDLVSKRVYADTILSIESLLSPRECAAWIRYGEDEGFERSFHTQTSEIAHRDNGRITLHSAEVAAALFARVGPFVPTEMDGRTAVACNSNIRIYRYAVGQRFGKHIDESVEDESGHLSQWTVLVYLNGGGGGEGVVSDGAAGGGIGPGEEGAPLRGGETVFYKGNYGGKIAASFSPKRGACLVHGHGRQCLLHEGAAVTSGVKYLLRTDVMYA